MAATQMRRPDDPLNAAGADAPRVRAFDRQDGKLTTLATNYNDTGHAYTCNKEREKDQDTTQLTGDLQPTERKVTDSAEKDLHGLPDRRYYPPDWIVSIHNQTGESTCRHRMTEVTEKGICAVNAAESCRRTNQAIQQDHRTAWTGGEATTPDGWTPAPKSNARLQR